MVGKSNFDFVARLQVNGSAIAAHSIRHDSCEVVNRVRNIRANIENLVAGAGDVNTTGNDGSYVADVRESSLLLAISEDRHGLALHQLIHEDSDHISIT